MNRIASALLSLMSNPTTSGVLLAALIGSNVFMISYSGDLERSIAVIEQQLSAITEQLEKRVDAEEKETADAKAREEFEKLHRYDPKKSNDEFLDMMSKRFNGKGWWGPREKNDDHEPLKSDTPAK